MTLIGKVSQIIYKNESNGYTVFLMKSEGEYITAVGETGVIEPGDEYEFEGEMVYHKSYGEQFAFTTMTKVLPSDANALIEYIAKSGIKGIGKKTAEKVIKIYGDDTLEVIRYKPDLLLDIKGFNDEKAYALSEYINDEWERFNLTSFLNKHGIGINMAMKIYDALGINAVNIIKENPYALMDFVSNLDFKTTDALATSLNIDETHPDRVKAGVIYILSFYIREGHTNISKDLLIDNAEKLLGVSSEHIENAIESLKHKDKVVVETRDEKEFVYRKSMYLAELCIANKVVELTRKPTLNIKLDKDIEKASERESIVLSDTQKEAVKTAIKNNISVITGGPGTGKTTIIKCVIDILKKREQSYVLAAPTGRAAKRITETTREDAKTLHRLLEITKIEDTDIDTFVNFPVTTIDKDVLIIDEASMIDTILMNNVMKALSDHTKLIIVGDSNQLPSVGAGNVLKDIINSGVVNTVCLTEIYRQSAKSDIIMGAHSVKAGEHINFKTKDTDLYYIEANGVEETKKELESLLTHRIKNFFGEDLANSVQVITPIKKTEIGTHELNKVIQKITLNPNDEMRHKKMGDRVFYENDKVMQIKNNYDINWDYEGVQGTGIYNGDIGYIETINNKDEYLIVDFDGRKTRYDFDELEQLEHAYAVTVHKSQGSEFDAVIIPLYVCFEKLFNRNLIYTAMTRAKRLLIFIGRKSVIDYMIDNTNEKARITGLKYKIENLML